MAGKENTRWKMESCAISDVAGKTSAVTASERARGARPCTSLLIDIERLGSPIGLEGYGWISRMGIGDPAAPTTGGGFDDVVPQPPIL